MIIVEIDKLEYIFQVLTTVVDTNFWNFHYWNDFLIDYARISLVLELIMPGHRLKNN